MKLILTGLIFLGYSLAMATKVNPDGILGHPSLNASYSNSDYRGQLSELFDFGAAMPITSSFTFLAGYNYQEFVYESYGSRSETQEIYNYVGGFKYYSQAVDSLDDMVNPDGKYNTVVTTLTLFA